MNGAEALALYAEHRSGIDLVLTDMSMPVMDGPATFLALQALDPAVRVVASSGLTSGRRLSKAAGIGIRHFVRKPYTTANLLETIHAALSEG